MADDLEALSGSRRRAPGAQRSYSVSVDNRHHAAPVQPSRQWSMNPSLSRPALARRTSVIGHRSAKNAVIRPRRSAWVAPGLLQRRRPSTLPLNFRARSTSLSPSVFHHPSPTPPRPPSVDLVDFGVAEEEDELPGRSLCRLFMLNSIAFAIEFCYSTETALVNPILLRIGLPEQYFSLTWFLSPLLGLFFQPFLGSFSDRCRCSWGRRRPFIFALCVGIVIGLVLLLFGDQIGKDISAKTNIWSIIITMVGVVFLDFSSDSLDVPCRAYIIDVCNSDDTEKALNMHAMMGGLGGGVGYIIAGIDWTHWTPSLSHALGGQYNIIFILNVSVSLALFALTLFSIKERPLGSSSGQTAPTPTQQVVVATPNGAATAHYGSLASSPRGVVGDTPAAASLAPHGEAPGTGDHLEPAEGVPRGILSSSPSKRKHVGFAPEATTVSQESDRPPLHRQLSYVVEEEEEGEEKGQGDAPQEGYSVDEDLEEPESIGALLKSIVKMPKVLALLCVNHLFSWLAFVTVLLFFTDYMGDVVYQGDPQGDPDQMLRYERGVKMGCWGLCIHAFSSALWTILLDRLLQAEVVSHRTACVGGELIFAVGTGLMSIFHDSVLVTLCLCPCIGVLFATISSVPFTIVAEFHESDKYIDGPKGRRGLGTDIAVIACQIFLAQVISSGVMSALIDSTGTHLVVMWFASGVAFVACIWSAIFVVYEIPEEPEEEKPLLSGKPLNV